MRMADDDESEARENIEPTDAAHVIRVFDDPAEIDAATWDALVAAQPSAMPFASMQRSDSSSLTTTSILTLGRKSTTYSAPR